MCSAFILNKPISIFISYSVKLSKSNLFNFVTFITLDTPTRRRTNCLVTSRPPFFPPHAFARKRSNSHTPTYSHTHQATNERAPCRRHSPTPTLFIPLLSDSVINIILLYHFYFYYHSYCHKY